MPHSFAYIISCLTHRLFDGGEGLFQGDPSAPRLCMDDAGRAVFFPPFLGGFGLSTVLTKEPLEMRMLPTDDFVKEALGEEEIPVLCQKGAPAPSWLVTVEDEVVHIHFDLLGTAFYILARVEEILNPARDEHDRFPASASHAFQNDYLHRPVVDELVEVLWRCIKYLWPGAERKQDIFTTMVTHDVDAPFEYLFRPSWRAVRVFGGDILKRKSPGLAFRRAAEWFNVKQLGKWEADPFYTFESIMDLSDRYGSRSAFYFMAGGCSAKDGDYCLGHHSITALMSRIHERGHEIGYHGSYNTYRDADKTGREVEHLLWAAERLGIKQDNWGGRQHYLRWSAPATWRNYAEAGLNYDATLSYADHAGFRCGTCHPFQPFDVEQSEPLNLTEYPLTVMECSVLDSRYMNLPHEEALQYILKLKSACRKYAGVFGLLWHNTRFVDPAEVELYRLVLEG